MDDIQQINGKPKKRFRLAIILITSFVVTPLLIVSIIYNTNKGFKNNINNTLSKMPGSLGEYFNNYPTEAEKSERIKYLANHYINLDTSVAVDKIYIIKKEDEDLYINLIKEMNEISSSKTEEIALKIRSMELRKDLLYSTYEEAIEEKELGFLDEVARFEKQDILVAVEEIEIKFSEPTFLKILDELSIDKISELLYYVDNDIRNYILDTFKINKSESIQKFISQKTRQTNNLIDMAKLYETKPIEESIKVLGNTENYSISDLASIYRNLSNMKAAILLSDIQDKEFIENLFIEIKKQDIIAKTSENTTENISKALDFLNDYNNKIKNLVGVYGKMEASQVADIVERMIERTSTTTSLELNGEEVYAISDRLIIIDVLSNIKNQTLSKILGSMDADKASSITSLLAQPENKFEGGEQDED